MTVRRSGILTGVSKYPVILFCVDLDTDRSAPWLPVVSEQLFPEVQARAGPGCEMEARVVQVNFEKPHTASNNLRWTQGRIYDRDNGHSRR